MSDSLQLRATSLSYAEVLDRFADQHTVTIAAGTTCAYLGDERNLREFLIADELAATLRRAGHIVTFLLIDDSMDPLNFRQLRVAVDKDPKLIERFQSWCGKPISQLPDPYQCHESYAAHFEEKLLARLHRLGCYPILVTTAKLYERGRYAPYMRLVLERHSEIIEFFNRHFPSNHPDKLFWLLCPHCHYIDSTRLTDVSQGQVVAHCERCQCALEQPVDQVQGKLNWKLDCAVRWNLLGIDVEPFSNPYLEPETGTFYIAQALSKEFFGGRTATPFPYGSVIMENRWSYKLLEAVPHAMLREMMISRPASDLKISRELLVTMASRHMVSPDLTYLDFVKQLLPMWMLAPHQLTAEQRDIVAHGVAFSQNFLDTEVRLHLPSREQFKDEHPDVLRGVHSLLEKVIERRRKGEEEWLDFKTSIKSHLSELGANQRPVLHRLRLIIGQQQGLPVSRLLFVLSLDYLMMVEYMIHLYLDSSYAVIEAGVDTLTNPDAAPQSLSGLHSIT